MDLGTVCICIVLGVPMLFILSLAFRLYLDHTEQPLEIQAYRRETMLNTEVTERIEEVKATGIKELHLWDNQLTTLPPEIGQLSKLKVLRLGGTTSLPP